MAKQFTGGVVHKVPEDLHKALMADESAHERWEDLTPLTAPFRGIFSTPTTEGDITTSVFETSTLIAIAVYAVIAWGIVKLATLNKS